MRALYMNLCSNDLHRNQSGNTGLWYDKFCDWPEKNRQVVWDLSSYKEGRREFNPKLKWIESVEGAVGNIEQLKASCKRLADMARHTWGIEIPQFYKTQWRFVTGLGREHPVENGFAWHHTLGVPYLPGSSVKGMVRTWAEQWLEEDDPNKCDISRIFGSRDAGEVGGVIFLDALPTDEVKLETDIMTPHYGSYYSDGETPGDWHDPVPIPFLAVAANQTFQFLITPRHLDDEQSRQDAETARGWLKDALEWIGAGAKTAVGYGRFERDIEEENAILEEKQKQEEDAEWQEKLKNMDPFERKVEEWIASAPHQQPYVVLLTHLDSDDFTEEETKKVALRIRILMEEKKVWKEKSWAKRPERDKKHQQTLKIMRIIGDG